MFDFISFYNLILGIRVVGAECQIHIAYVLLECQVSIQTFVAYDTVVLSWVGLQTTHRRNRITGNQDVFTTIGEVVHREVDLSVQQTEVETEVGFIFNLPTQVGVVGAVFTQSTEPVLCITIRDARDT